MDEYNLDFWNLVIRISRYRLSIRETKYLLWKFYSKKSGKQIARLDDRKINRAAVSFVIRQAYRKIKLNIRNL